MKIKDSNSKTEIIEKPDSELSKEACEMGGKASNPATLKPVKKETIADLLPAKSVLGSKKARKEFLQAVVEEGGKWTIACRNLGLKNYDVWVYFEKNPHFRSEVDRLKKFAEDQYYNRLEQISEENAENPKAVTERIFQLNALNSAKYRPKQAGIQANNIQINTTSLNIGDRVDVVNQLRNKKKPKPKGKTAVSQTIIEDTISADDVRI